MHPNPQLGVVASGIAFTFDPTAPSELCTWQMATRLSYCGFQGTLYGLALTTELGKTHLVYTYEDPSTNATTLALATDTDGSYTFPLLATLLSFPDSPPGSPAIPRAVMLSGDVTTALVYQTTDNLYNVEYVTAGSPLSAGSRDASDVARRRRAAVRLHRGRERGRGQSPSRTPRRARSCSRARVPDAPRMARRPRRDTLRPMPPPVAVEVRSPVRAGEVVDGKYRIDGILGAGGWEVVVSATHLALDEPVALKFMTAEGKADDTARARFLREAKAARKLTSAHVARVFDVGQLKSGEPYIVMERLNGDDLAKHLRTSGRLSPGDTVRYVLQVCDAIREAHALGIVHRDLKPQNLFLSRRAGSGAVIKVLDFGIAKSLDLADTNSSLTASQNVVGSPVYMSPEQLRASKHVDTRTDIWSIGVIMFELLSGKVPFAGDSVLELGMRIMTVAAPSLATLRAEIPEGLADIVQKCLEKDPDNRFATIDALAVELRPYADISQRQPRRSPTP